MQTEKERVIAGLKGWQFSRKRHGSLYDRGSADSYYGRAASAHYGGVGSDTGPRVDNLTQEEIAEYIAGYRDNEQFGDKKSWD